MDFQVKDVDGNEVVMNDQGEVLDASHSQANDQATEETPRAPEADPTKSQVEAKKPDIDYQKSYKELERTYQRQQQELTRLRKEYEESYSPYKEKLPAWQKANELLEKDPAAFQYLQARLQGYSHENAQSLVNHAQQNPHVQQMLEKVQNLESFVNKAQEKESRAENDRFLDQQESKANAVYKEFFGKDMTASEKTAMYQWMTSRNVFDGEAAIQSLYAKQYAESYAQKVLQDQKVKGTKGLTRTDTRNSSTAKAPEKAMSFREAFNASMKELRGE